MLDKVKELIGEVSAFNATTKDEIEAFRIKFLSKKGILNDLFTEFKNVAPSERKEFGQALGLADFVVVLEVFAPGEEPIPGASGSTMANNVPLPPEQVVFEPSWSKVPGHLVEHAQPGNIVITLGAGDIGMMCPEILTMLESM